MRVVAFRVALHEQLIGMGVVDHRGIPRPDDPVSRWWVIRAVQVPTQHGHDEHRTAQGLRRWPVPLPCDIAQHPDLQIGEQHPGGQLRRLPAQQGHGQQPPGDDGLDRDGPLQVQPRHPVDPLRHTDRGRDLSMAHTYNWISIPV